MIFSRKKISTATIVITSIIAIAATKQNNIKNLKNPWNIKPVPKMIEDKSLTKWFKYSKPVGKLELKLDAKRLKKLDLHGVELYFSEEDIRKFPEMIKKDKRIRKTWGWLCAKTKKIIYSYNNPSGKKGETYIYSINQMKFPAFVWMCTGDKELGRAIKEILLDAAKRPMSFWIHDALRKFNPKYPVGALETASAGGGLATAWHWTRDLWTPQESKFIKDAIKIKSMYPIMRWLEVPKTQYANWQAAMAGNAVIITRVLGNEKAERFTVAELKKWLNSFEDDGSYNEPLSYLYFGFANLLPGIIAQGKDKAIKFAQGTHLKGNLEYLVYNYCKPKSPTNGRPAIGVNFGDGDFPAAPHQAMCYYLSYAFNNGLGIWLNQQYYHGRYSFETLLMKIMFAESSLKAVSPEELNLPAAKYFDCGVAFIRLGWKPLHDVMFALRSGDGGKTLWAHDYPNRNAIMLVQDGELMLNTPGRSSYRNPIHESYDKLISSHCAVNFGDKNQNKKAVSKVLSIGNTSNYASIVSEASEAYKLNAPPPQRVRRRVLCLKKPRIFVMWDEIIRRHNRDVVNWRFYFNNYDGTGKMKKLSRDMVEYKRNGVALKVFTVSEGKAEYEFGKGIMHKGYSYFAGGPNEGKMGSTVFWLCKNIGKKEKTSFYSVFGAPEWNATLEKHQGNDVIVISKDNAKYEISFNTTSKQMNKGSMKCVHSIGDKQIEKVLLHDQKGLVEKR